jgi:hypothetical protein
VPLNTLSSSVFTLDDDTRRRFRIGFKGLIDTQQIAQQRRIADNISKPVCQPNLLNKIREKGPNVIEPIPVPAVTIPKIAYIDHQNKQKSFI